MPRTRDKNAGLTAPIPSTPDVCELCGRAKPLTFHHLIPKAMHGKTRYRKRYTKEEMHTRGLMVCRLCHNGIHDLIEEKQLGEEFNTKEKLLTHEPLLKHIAWVRKQK